MLAAALASMSSSSWPPPAQAACHCVQCGACSLSRCMHGPSAAATRCCWPAACLVPMAMRWMLQATALPGSCRTAPCRPPQPSCRLQDRCRRRRLPTTPCLLRAAGGCLCSAARTSVMHSCQRPAQLTRSAGSTRRGPLTCGALHSVVQDRQSMASTISCTHPARTATTAAADTVSAAPAATHAASAAPPPAPSAWRLAAATALPRCHTLTTWRRLQPRCPLCTRCTRSCRWPCSHAPACARPQLAAQTSTAQAAGAALPSHARRQRTCAFAAHGAA
jgi:hypothetical protein